jgi:hypothetical protein
MVMVRSKELLDPGPCGFGETCHGVTSAGPRGAPNGCELSGAADLHGTSNRALAASAPASC